MLYQLTILQSQALTLAIQIFIDHLIASGVLFFSSLIIFPASSSLQLLKLLPVVFSLADIHLDFIFSSRRSGEGNISKKASELPLLGAQLSRLQALGKEAVIADLWMGKGFSKAQQHTVSYSHIRIKYI